jgi:hypothetical protein
VHGFLLSTVLNYYLDNNFGGHFQIAIYMDDHASIHAPLDVWPHVHPSVLWPLSNVPVFYLTGFAYRCCVGFGVFVVSVVTLNNFLLALTISTRCGRIMPRLV